MKTVTLKVENVRLKLTTNLHIVSQNIQLDLANKRVLGVIQSFKSDKVIDAFNETGQLSASQHTQFIINDVDLTKSIPDIVSDYVDANLLKLVSA